jgi:branched-chain amino acid transport system substrate-binding protein
MQMGSEFLSGRSFPVGRRQFLTLAGGTGAAAFLAACGSSGGSKTPAGAAPSAIGEQINKLIAKGGTSAGQGKTFNLGALEPMTGSGSYYGLEASRGFKLAISQIEAAGGPKINLVLKDQESGNTTVAVEAVRQMGLNGIGACLMSYAAVDGAALPGIAEYKMLSLDGSGGTAQVFDDKPYFWGTRSEGGKDFYGGVFTYVHKYLPAAKKLFLVAYDSGAALNELNTNELKAVLPAYGIELVGTLFHPGGLTDYSSILAQIQAKSPDVILADEVGLDAGYFMKGYVTTGMTAQVIGFEFTPDAAKIAGSAYNKYWFSGDYFDAANPINPFGKLFVQTFTKAYGVAPEFYAADAYDDTFKFWQMVRDVIAKGGDINNGTQLQNALIANPTFPSVYGGTATSVGTETMNLKTHSVLTRGLGLFKVVNGEPSPLALFQTGSTTLTDVTAP